MSDFTDCQCQGDAGCPHHDLQVPPSLIAAKEPKDGDLAILFEGDNDEPLLCRWREIKKRG